jgi:chromosomal replication initiator protein
MHNAQQVWQAALGELELQMTRATFNTWIKPVAAVSWDRDTFVLGTPNGYIKDWLENRLYAPIHRTLSGILEKKQLNVQFIVWSQEHGVDQSSSLPLFYSAPEQDPSWSSGNGHRSRLLDSPIQLNPRYTFDTFVVGPSNRLANAAALAVTDKPAMAYNPLFLYGGVGLGKTHLMHAIGHRCLQKGLGVLYVSSEQFTNDLIKAIRTQKTEEFRLKYRNADVLLIDDIQFIAGKESTQEEFFHTFNTLHAANKQIVLTSDRPPKAIPTLEERLRSRFEWGLLADIQPPDLETRIAILQFKAESQPINISEEMLNMIAERVVSNIRELEGALTTLVAHAKLTPELPTQELLEKSLQDNMAFPKTTTVDQVLQAVAAFYHVQAQQITGRGRRKEIVRPRHVAMYLARHETESSLPEIGAALGGRDHTTVMYGVQKIEGLIEQDSTLRREISAIRKELPHTA